MLKEKLIFMIAEPVTYYTTVIVVADTNRTQNIKCLKCKVMPQAL